jgi:hypothetical protein
MIPNLTGDYHYQACLWKCDCGNTHKARKINVLYGHTRSCGCSHWPRKSQAQNWQGHGEIPLRSWNQIRANAKTRKLPFEITIQEAWKLFLTQNRKCAFTSEELIFPPGGRTEGKENLGTASLDRITNTKGYTIDNVQWVHKYINFMKRELSSKDFILWCKKVVDNNTII